jgi:antitoxin component YwqK of YwqJK toxin-antitoxin module
VGRRRRGRFGGLENWEMKCVYLGVMCHQWRQFSLETFGILMNRFFIYSLIFLTACNSIGKKEVKTFNADGLLDNIKSYEKADDTLNYYVKYFNKNGAIKCEGQKIDHHKIGKWKYYNNQQNLISIEKFGSDGLLCDTQTYFFEDGKLDRYKILDQPIKCFCDSPRHYSFTQVAYWRNGKLREINHEVDCEWNGKTLLYDSTSGILSEEFIEVKGAKNGAYKKFYLDSSVMFGNYKDGQPIGIWRTMKGDSLISVKAY